MTINEVFQGLDTERRRLLQGSVIADGVAPSTAFQWLTGRRRPMLLYRERITEHVNRITGGRRSVGELFPEPETVKGGRP